MKAWIASRIVQLEASTENLVAQINANHGAIAALREVLAKLDEKAEAPEPSPTEPIAIT